MRCIVRVTGARVGSESIIFQFYFYRYGVERGHVHYGFGHKYLDGITKVYKIERVLFL